MIPVDAIEMGVFSWPKGMDGWRFYRIEYGGHAMDCVEEAGVWLPPEVDVERVLRVIRGARQEYEELLAENRELREAVGQYEHDETDHMVRLRARLTEAERLLREADCCVVCRDAIDAFLTNQKEGA